MDAKGSVAIFVSEGANAARIDEELVAKGEKVDRDAFGHVKLDKVNVGDWFSNRLSN
jgi:pyrophosphate--fructose-6-phosphate 1-phosphotransferase